MQLTTSEYQQLTECETIIKQGLQTFYEVGNALLIIRDGRLYRQEYSTFEAYCQDKWNMTRRHVDRLIASSSVAETLRPIGLKVEKGETVIENYPLPATESQARPLTSLEPDVQRTVWQEAVDTAPNGKITATHVERVVESYKEAPKPHVSHNSGNNEWYTPQEYIEAAWVVLGTIDLDPASSYIANQQIGASSFFDVDTNGLAHHWQGKVWLNPPYASNLIADFIEKLKHHVENEDVTEAIVLVNNATETGWFNTLISISSAVVFPSARVKFWSPDRGSSTPLQGQAILYIGEELSLFLDTFKKFGWGAKMA